MSHIQFILYVPLLQIYRRVTALLQVIQHILIHMCGKIDFQPTIVGAAVFPVYQESFDAVPPRLQPPESQTDCFLIAILPQILQRLKGVYIARMPEQYNISSGLTAGDRRMVPLPKQFSAQGVQAPQHGE